MTAAQALSWPLALWHWLILLLPELAVRQGELSSEQRREGYQPLGYPQASPLKGTASSCSGDFAAGLSFARCTGRSDHSWCIWGTDSSVRCSLTSLFGVMGSEAEEQG